MTDVAYTDGAVGSLGVVAAGIGNALRDRRAAPFDVKVALHDGSGGGGGSSTIWVTSRDLGLGLDRGAMDNMEEEEERSSSSSSGGSSDESADEVLDRFAWASWYQPVLAWDMNTLAVAALTAAPVAKEEEEEKVMAAGGEWEEHRRLVQVLVLARRAVLARAGVLWRASSARSALDPRCRRCGGRR